MRNLTKASRERCSNDALRNCQDQELTTAAPVRPWLRLMMMTNLSQEARHNQRGKPADTTTCRQQQGQEHYLTMARGGSLQSGPGCRFPLEYALCSKAEGITSPWPGAGHSNQAPAAALPNPPGACVLHQSLPAWLQSPSSPAARCPSCACPARSSDAAAGGPLLSVAPISCAMKTKFAKQLSLKDTSGDKTLDAWGNYCHREQIQRRGDWSLQPHAGPSSKQCCCGLRLHD